MPETFLILHGIENHRPPRHWQYWLSEQLRGDGRAVSYPALPEPDAPLYRDWEAALRTLLTATSGDRLTVVCHSLACLLWLRAASELARPVDRLLLVAPPASECVPDTGASFRLEQFDAESVRSSVTGELLIACSDTDPYNPHGAQSLYGDALGYVRSSYQAQDTSHQQTASDPGLGPWSGA